MRELHDAWSRTITAEDYEAHMAAIGQAQANAALVAEYLQAQPPSYKKAVGWWVLSAKKEETRLKRLEKLVAYSEQGERIPELRRKSSKEVP